MAPVAAHCWILSLSTPPHLVSWLDVKRSWSQFEGNIKFPSPMLLAFPSWTWLTLSTPWNREKFWHGLTKTPREDVGMKSMHATSLSFKEELVQSSLPATCHLHIQRCAAMVFALPPPLLPWFFFPALPLAPAPLFLAGSLCYLLSLSKLSLNSGDKVTLYSFWLVPPRTFCSSESRWPCQLSWPRAAQWVSTQWWYPGILEERARCWIWVD